MRSVLRALTVLVLTLLLMGSAWSQATPSAKPANAEPSSDAATLVMFNRPVVVFRSSLLGAPPKARVDRARFSINEALNQGGKLAVSVKNNPEGQLLMIDERLAFVVTAGDVDPLRQDDVKATASQAARQLELIIAENREARDLHMLLTALGISAIATLRLWADGLAGGAGARLAGQAPRFKRGEPGQASQDRRHPDHRGASTRAFSAACAEGAALAGGPAADL
jgi:hypothetical protein